MPDNDKERKPATWMIVEDDAAIRMVIETMCELWELQALIFEDGFRAMKYLADNPLPAPLPDVALLDIRVPGPWGQEIGASIRQHPQLRDIGVILMTGYELQSSEEDRYLQVSGADRILYKPLPAMDELRDMVDAVLAGRQAKQHNNAKKGEKPANGEKKDEEPASGEKKDENTGTEAG
jgi:CheY-like chemotaxis protein